MASALFLEPMELPRYFTPAQVAEMLQVTQRTVYSWLSTGQLTSKKFGGQWRISESDLMKFGKRPKGHAIYNLTTREAAERLSVSPSTIQQWIREEKIPGVKVKGVWRVALTDVLHMKSRRK